MSYESVEPKTQRRGPEDVDGEIFHNFLVLRCRDGHRHLSITSGSDDEIRYSGCGTTTLATVPALMHPHPVGEHHRGHATQFLEALGQHAQRGLASLIGAKRTKRYRLQASTAQKICSFPS